MLPQRLQSNMAVATLGYAADVALGDLTNPGVAAVKFKDVRHLAAALAECVAHPQETRRWALAKSGELRFRDNGLLQQFHRQRNALTKRRFPGREHLDLVVDNAFVFFETTDALTATPIWVGAYREGLVLYDANDALAVEYADKLLRETFPSQSAVDKSAWQRKYPLLLLFYGYLNMIFNLRRDVAHDAYVVFKEPGSSFGDKAGAVARAAWKWVAIVAAAQVAGEFISGRGPEPDEKYSQWLLRKALAGLTTNDLPFGYLAEPVTSFLATGKKRRVSARAAPAISVLQTASESMLKAIDGKGDATEFFDIARSLGIVFGIPTRPLRAAEYVTMKAPADVRAGRLNEVPAGIIYGERKGQPANPLVPEPRRK